MELNFIPVEWESADHLPYLVELVLSMDVTPGERMEILRAWGEVHGVSVEGAEIGGEE